MELYDGRPSRLAIFGFADFGPSAFTEAFPTISARVGNAGVVSALPSLENFSRRENFGKFLVSSFVYGPFGKTTNPLPLNRTPTSC